MIDPVTGFTLVTKIIDAAKKIGELGTKVKSFEEKQTLSEVWNELQAIKQEAASLGDENRDLREQLRFKSDDFYFENPFWYDKSDTARRTPLCAKCFSGRKASPMANEYKGAAAVYRRCLVCETPVFVAALPPNLMSQAGLEALSVASVIDNSYLLGVFNTEHRALSHQSGRLYLSSDWSWCSGYP